MLTNLQLRNFDRFLSRMQPAGVTRPAGAYDARLDARKHGIDARDFARGGVFDEEGGIGREPTERLREFLRSKLSPTDFDQISKMLDGEADDAIESGEHLANRVLAWSKSARLSPEDAASLAKLLGEPVGDYQPKAGRAFGAADSRLTTSSADFARRFPNAARIPVSRGIR